MVQFFFPNCPQASAELFLKSSIASSTWRSNFSTSFWCRDRRNSSTVISRSSEVSARAVRMGATSSAGGGGAALGCAARVRRGIGGSPYLGIIFWGKCPYPTGATRWNGNRTRCLLFERTIEIKMIRKENETKNNCPKRKRELEDRNAKVRRCL